MLHPASDKHTCVPEASTSHPHDPLSTEPIKIPSTLPSNGAEEPASTQCLEEPIEEPIPPMVRDQSENSLCNTSLQLSTLHKKDEEATLSPQSRNGCNNDEEKYMFMPKESSHIPAIPFSASNEEPNSSEPHNERPRENSCLCVPEEPTNIPIVPFSMFSEDAFLSSSSQPPGRHLKSEQHTCIPETPDCHPGDPIPKEPTNLPTIPAPILNDDRSGASSASQSLGRLSSNPTTPSTSPIKANFDESSAIHDGNKMQGLEFSIPHRRRASTALISASSKDVRRILAGSGEAETKLVEKVCCGGGCCFMDALTEKSLVSSDRLVVPPDNDAFRSLNLELGPLSFESELTKIVDLPPPIISFKSLSSDARPEPSTVRHHPPRFVTPHFPYEVYPSRVNHARELTKPGAEKRTYHFDLDVTDYPVEGGDVEFVVGGAVGVCAPNPGAVVDDIFDSLNVPSFVRDKQVVLKSESGRWPTIWGDDKARELTTTRRELLTWCSDVQSYPPTKPLLRLLAEYAEAENEKKILMFLSSAQGQAAFCDLRTGPHITIVQLLKAFPSSHPPFPHLLSILNALMPRFYSLSQDPQISRTQEGGKDCRLIEFAVTVHETPDWRGGTRTGVGSGYLERVAQQIIQAEKEGTSPADLKLHIPMFRGLMSNPLAREFVTDGPMLLIGAGVGVAPFRGFVQRRLKSANCANKVWVLQGVRDSLLDELYSGEWGVTDDQVKKVVESRRGEGRYVQEEVRQQADLVWFVINALDGRVFVCGSSVGMGEGVEKALVDVVVDKGNLNQEEAEQFWARKKAGGQYIAVSIRLLITQLVNI